MRTVQTVEEKCKGRGNKKRRKIEGKSKKITKTQDIPFDSPLVSPLFSIRLREFFYRISRPVQLYSFYAQTASFSLSLSLSLSFEEKAREGTLSSLRVIVPFLPFSLHVKLDPFLSDKSQIS